MAEFSVTTGRDGSRSFGEHDDRTWDGGNQRGRGRGYRGNSRTFRGGRNAYRRGGYRGGRDRGYGDNNYHNKGGANPRSRLDAEGDDAMGDEVEDRGHQRRYNPYGRPPRSNSRYTNRRGDSNYRGDSVGRGAYKRLGLPIDSKASGDSQWFKVQIPWGKKADKEFILKNINNLLDVPLVPTYFHYEDKSAVFYVNDRHTSYALRAISKRITMPNGYGMSILVRESQPPYIPMGEEELSKLKVVMSNRYDPPTKSLNLSSLHTDTDLAQEKLYMNLSRPQVMTNIVKIISENIPELVSLTLSKNKIDRLDNLASLVSKTPDMRVLDLSENRIMYMSELEKLKVWKLEGLHLAGNAVADKFTERTSYVSAVRKIFPKVVKLDGDDLPPPITFDIEARTDLPKSKDSFFPSVDVQGTLVRFLKEYFTVYDSDNRSGLTGAYHDGASFSLSSAYNAASAFKQASLSVYIEESRNMCRGNNKDTGRKFKLLKTGNHIVPQLCLLPKTQHDLNSLLVDVNLVSPTMMCFNVQGVFKEVSKSEKHPIRAFSRTFVTVPGGHSMLIVNDMLTITNASQDQTQSAFKNPAPTPSSSPVPQTTPTNPFEGVAGLTPEQQQMIASFMNDSGMNPKFSTKCLMENGWDYAKAGQVFLEVQKKGQIPPEAFIK